MTSISSGNLSVAQGLYGAQKSTTNSMNKLSSGKKFASAAEDVSALSIATQMAAQLSGMRAEYQNTAMSDAMLQIADGGLNQIGNMLQRQQELATQASNGSLTTEQRGFLNREFQALSTEINRIAGNTNFNGINLLNGGGSSTALANTDALASALTGNNSAGSTNAIQAFNSTNGSSLLGNAATGQLRFVDGGGAALTDAGFNNVSSAVSGNFDNFSISNVSYGTSATVTAEINGVRLSGTAANGATSVVVSDGRGTNIELALSNFNLTDAGTVSGAESQLRTDFANTSIQRTNTVGTNFSGTALSGVTGGAGGAAMLRIAGSGASISNFQYVGNNGANDNTLSVQVNGETYTATGVSDSINAGDVITFERADGQALQVDFTGLTNSINNIRGSASDRNNLVNGLNQGFAQAGNNGSVGIGDGSSDIALTLGSATATSLYQGQALDISTATGAANASSVVGRAISSVTSLRADVGATQSRVNYAASQLQDSMISLEAARSRLADTDVAEESSKLVAARLRAQMSTAILAQTNRMQSNVLNLLN